jgi:hypothetical protein
MLPMPPIEGNASSALNLDEGFPKPCLQQSLKPYIDPIESLSQKLAPIS